MTDVKDREDSMPDGTEGRAASERRCIVTREALEKDRLMKQIAGG